MIEVGAGRIVVVVVVVAAAGIVVVVEIVVEVSSEVGAGGCHQRNC